jgi:hypothetical protein
VKTIRRKGTRTYPQVEARTPILNDWEYATARTVGAEEKILHPQSKIVVKM